ncbi:inorganic phosphate cotransporter-like 1 [Homarus americanus]|uniref:Inorganic phosphate cotransporter-like 1 n=1 Tax=Homarus americanus TaxID=6706 RepID=A0A8J5MTH4_HOMAM|nr:inorganic phosphate cotransporter-like 1 [Homarus americanus]
MMSSIEDLVVTKAEYRQELVEDHQHVPRPKILWGARHTLALLGFLGFAVVYAMRVNLSVAIVAMVKPQPHDNTSDHDGDGGDFDWNGDTQGLVLGSFFYGYAVTNLMGGRAAEYVGPKLVYGMGVLLTSLFTILSPICAEFSAPLFITLRIFEGFTEGVTFPAMSFMLASWVPPNERAKLSSLVYAGAQFGTVVTLTASGWMCDSDFLGGWPSVFYVFGGLGVIWSIAWFCLAYNHPQLHPRISEEEKHYILHYCGNKRTKPVVLPWKAILTSMPVWAAVMGHLGSNWGFYTLLTELPTYLSNIQHFDMKSNGIRSGLPYLCNWLFSIIYSNLMDWLLVTKRLSILAVRKISNIIAMVVLCLAVGMNGAIFSGYMCSHQDLSPNLAGTLMGITNTVATLPGFISPSVTGALTDGNQTLSAWRTVFIIASVIYFICNTFYLVFISADVQPWNDPTPTTKEGEGEGEMVKKENVIKES